MREVWRSLSSRHRGEVNGRLKLIVSVVVICVVIAIVAMRLGSGGGGTSAPKGRAPEEALPQFDANANYVVASIRNVGEISGLLDLISQTAKMSDTAEGLGVPGVDSVVGDAVVAIVDRVKPYVESVDDAAVLAAEGGAVISFITTEEKYAALIERMRSDGSLAVWETKVADGGEAYRWDLGGLELFLIKSVDGKTVQLTAATSEEGAQSSAAAWADPKGRAKIDRKLKAPSYVVARMAIDSLGGKKRDHKVEAAWSVDASRIVLDVDNDLELAGIKPKTSGMESSPIPMYGTGEPAVLLTLDIPQVISMACPDVDDPAELVLSLCEMLAKNSVPGEFRSDVKDLMMTTRISLGVFMKDADIMPSSTYVVLESSKASLIQQYLGMASLFMSKEKIGSWSDAYTTELDGFNIVLATGENKILLGTGKPEEFASAAKRPADLSSVPDKGVLSMLYISTKCLTDKDTAIGGLLASAAEDDQDLKEMLGFLGAVKSILSVQTSPSTSQIVIQRGAAK